MHASRVFALQLWDASERERVSAQRQSMRCALCVSPVRAHVQRVELLAFLGASAAASAVRPTDRPSAAAAAAAAAAPRPPARSPGRNSLTSHESCRSRLLAPSPSLPPSTNKEKERRRHLTDSPDNPRRLFFPRYGAQCIRACYYFARNCFNEWVLSCRARGTGMPTPREAWVVMPWHALVYPRGAQQRQAGKE
jgi:hypothetical protein